jgi:hypothetical protein
MRSGFPIPKDGFLSIRDRDFRITSAELSEILVSQHPQWTLFIQTEEKEFIEPGIVPPIPFRWAPNIRGESVSVDAPPLSQITGKTIKVPLAYDEKTDEYHFSMYVFGHEDVFDSEITFWEQRGSEFLITWTGKCNIHFDKLFGEDIPFALKTWMQIKG